MTRELKKVQRKESRRKFYEDFDFLVEQLSKKQENTIPGSPDPLNILSYFSHKTWNFMYNFSEFFFSYLEVN